MTPPRVPSLFRRALHPRHREAILGDLCEEYLHNAGPRLGPWRARVWFYAHLLRSIISSRMLELWFRRDEARSRRVKRSQGVDVFRNLRRDLMYSIRALRAKPFVSVVAIATLAFGIGATAAMFSVVNAVLLRPLPYETPDELVHIRGTLNGEKVGNVSYADFMEVRDRSTAFSAVSAWQGWEVTIDDGSGAPTRRRAASVSHNFFDTLRARPALGRFFTIEEGASGHPPVVVISHALWQAVFGGEPSAVGAELRLEGGTYTVVGVTEPDFVDPIEAASPWGAPHVWRSHPPVFDRAADNRSWRGFWAMGRLKPGESLENATAELHVLGQNLAESFPESNASFGFYVASFHDQLVGAVRPAVLALVGAVALLLLIACANVANLLLSRAASRRKEIALRTALGASRGRLIRQLLTESAVLALIGGALGLALARLGIVTLIALGQDGLPRVDEVGLDGQVFLFTLGASLLTALVFGLGPAFHVTDTSLSNAMGASSLGAEGRRFRNGLVVAEISMAVVLLVGAGLFLKSMERLLDVDSGMVAEGVLTLRVAPSVEAYADGAALTGVTETLLERLQSLPGVATAGTISDLPLSGAANSVWMFRDDRPRPKSGEEPLVLIRAVSPDYFRAMGIRLEDGRSFTKTDGEESPRVAIVNRATARRYFPDEDPIGKRISLMGVSREIVGVAGDVRQSGLAEESHVAVYTPYRQEDEEWLRRALSIVLRTEGDPTLFAGAVRHAVQEVDPSMPINDLVPMSAVVEDDVAQPRFRTVLLTTFALMAMLLAAIGIGSVMAYSVSQRTREIAVRVALGADRGTITSLVMREAATLTVAGIAVGVAGSLFFGKLVSSLLFEVSPHDGAVLTAVVSLLAAVSLLTSYLPALRAAHVAPNTALKSE